jgi:hypothetical protein
MQEIKHFRGYCFISLSVLYYENKYQGKFFPLGKPIGAMPLASGSAAMAPFLAVRDLNCNSSVGRSFILF